MSKKKMILITDSFPYGSGESSFILPEIRWLQQAFDLSIISCGTSNERTAGLSADIGVYRSPSNMTARVLGNAKAFFEPMVYREIYRAFKYAKYTLLAIPHCVNYFGESDSFAKLFKGVVEAEGQPDIVYCYWHRAPLLGVLRTRKSYPGMKVVARAHGHDLFADRYPSGYIPYKQECDELIDRVYLACQSGLDYYNAHHSVSEPKKSKVAYIGTDNNALSPWSECDTLRLVSCSDMVEAKRLEVLIDALSLLDDLRVRWTHIGDGRMRESLERQAADKLGKRSNITCQWVGEVPNSEVRRHLETVEHDYFITTAKSGGGVPMAVVEACSYGLPVIATDVGGVSEIVGDDNGLLLPRDISAQQLADALRKAAALDYEGYIEKRECSLEKWRAKFVAAENAKRFVSELLELCEE